MAEEKMPFVAVVGGLWDLKPAEAADAKAVAKTIGAELAKAGFGLVVYYSNDKSLEPHVVSGYVEALGGAGRSRVRVRCTQQQRADVKFKEETTHKELFVASLFPGDDWEAPFYQSLAEEDGVDAVLLIAGMTSTLIAGQIAVARRIPILAVAKFGGSSRVIWRQLANAAPGNHYPSWGNDPDEVIVKKLKADCDLLAGRRKERAKREELFATIASQQRKAIAAGIAFVALLLTCYFGMLRTPEPSSYAFVMFIGLVSAGATGALARITLWEPKNGDARTSAILGAIAGFVVGLAYLIPQFVGAPAVLQPDNNIVSAQDKIQFASAVLVALSAGVGFDTIFGRLRKKAEGAEIGPPGKSG